MAGYMFGKLDVIVRSTRYQRSQDQSLLKQQIHGMKDLYLQFYQDTSLRTYTVPINSVFSIKDFPRKYSEKGEKYSGSKHSKVRLTGMAAATADGEKLAIFVIGKSLKPKCFKNFKSFPVVIDRKWKVVWTVSFLMNV